MQNPESHYGERHFCQLSAFVPLFVETTASQQEEESRRWRGQLWKNSEGFRGSTETTITTSAIGEGGSWMDDPTGTRCRHPVKHRTTRPSVSIGNRKSAQPNGHRVQPLKADPSHIFLALFCDRAREHTQYAARPLEDAGLFAISRRHRQRMSPMPGTRTLLSCGRGQCIASKCSEVSRNSGVLLNGSTLRLDGDRLQKRAGNREDRMEYIGHCLGGTVPRIQ